MGSESRYIVHRVQEVSNPAKAKIDMELNVIQKTTTGAELNQLLKSALEHVGKVQKDEVSESSESSEEEFDDSQGEEEKQEEEVRHFGLNTLDQILALATDDEKKEIARRLKMKASSGGNYFFKTKKKGRKEKKAVEKK